MRRPRRWIFRFHAGSDVDILVSFADDADWSLLDHLAMEEELSLLLERKVDLVTRRAVARSRNPIRMKGLAKYKDTVSKSTNWYLVPTAYSQV